MSSPARIEANRVNARLSTGPQTDGGKVASSANATRHGLTGARVVIKGEIQEEYDALLAGLLVAYKPANVAEEIVVQQIAANYWRLLRARRIEAGMYDSVLCEAADETAAFLANEKQFDNIRRYATSIENAYHRAIEQLRRLQRDRKQDDGFVSQPAKTARRVVSIQRSIPDEASTSPRLPSEQCLSSDPLPLLRPMQPSRHS
jgi:hypothetical protein